MDRLTYYGNIDSRQIDGIDIYLPLRMTTVESNSTDHTFRSFVLSVKKGVALGPQEKCRQLVSGWRLGKNLHQHQIALAWHRIHPCVYLLKQRDIRQGDKEERGTE